MSYFEGAKGYDDESADIYDVIEPITKENTTSPAPIYTQPDTDLPVSFFTKIINNISYWTPGILIVVVTAFCVNTLLTKYTEPDRTDAHWTEWLKITSPLLSGTYILMRLYGPEKRRRHAELSNTEKQKEWDRLENEMVSGLQQEAFALLE